MRSVIALLVLVFLTACSTPSHYNIRQVSQNELHDFDRSYIEYEVTPNSTLQVERVLDPQDALQTSQSLTASQYSTPVPAGTSPGQAAAGGLIATMIVASMNKEKAYTQAQQKAEVLISTLESIKFSDQLLEKSTMVFSEFDIIPQIATNSITKENKSGIAKVVVSPQVSLSNNLGKAKVKANITIINNHADSVIYKNSFEYWSAPVLPNSGESERQEYWDNNEAEALLAELNIGLSNIRSMFEHDLKEVLTPENTEKGQAKTLRYQDTVGKSFLRGELIKRSENRFEVRDLRGNIMSIAGTVQ